jgi:GWxTD domain-containing protein
LESQYRKWLNEDVAYIITDTERKAFQALITDNDREQFIDQFWKRRDPTPDTERNEYREEHYRRIAYTNERFAPSGGTPGWKTDRGRIYIEYGPPDEIESHPSGGSYQRPQAQGGGTTTTYPFEQWRYRYIEGLGSNIILEFVDGEKNGEYHLTTDPSQKEALSNPSLAIPEQRGRGRGARGAPPAGEGQFDRPRDSMANVAPAGRPLQVVQGGPPTELDRVRAQMTAHFFAAELAELRTKYAEEHPDVVAAKAKLDQAQRNEAAINTNGFGSKHSGVLIYPEGKVTFVIPLEGPGPFHVYGRVRTPDGLPVAAFEDNTNAGQLNYVGTFTLKPGSYIFSASRKSSDTEGATETATFEVK